MHKGQRGDILLVEIQRYLFRVYLDKAIRHTFDEACAVLIAITNTSY